MPKCETCDGTGECQGWTDGVCPHSGVDQCRDCPICPDCHGIGETQDEQPIHSIQRTCYGASIVPVEDTTDD